MTRLPLRAVLLWLCFLLPFLCVQSSCGGGSVGNVPATPLVGRVSERARGYTSRPTWAEPDQPWTRREETLIAVGYVSIAANQRLEIGYRAADSYARSELLRFLATRVVAVLSDEQDAAGRKALEETVIETAEAAVDAWLIVERYWEKRRDGRAERYHIFSRLEVDQAQVRELLLRAAQTKDLRLSPEELGARLGSRWDRLTKVAELSELELDLPEGMTIPPWAQSGDTSNEAGFSFVCHGRSDDEAKAQALAQARCNEKLCRLFGVQITARTSVRENLEGISAESEVTEQCERVRVSGRETRNKSSECSDGSCVYWLRQTYPKRAYQEEKLRLERPSVVRQEVVIQEGERTYQDPAACQTALTRYSEVLGLSARDYVRRANELETALETCQGIDSRDSGLFISLNLLLTENLWSFVFAEGRGSSARSYYAAVPKDWGKRLETERFLTTRIQMVLEVVRAAIFPMKLLDATEANTQKDTSQSEFDALIREVVEHPMNDTPIAATHASNVHLIVLGAHWNRRRPSPIYRTFVLNQLEKPGVVCDEPRSFNAGTFADYLYADGTLDDTEFRALLKALERKPSRRMSECLLALVGRAEREPARATRVREIAAHIAQGRLIEIEPSSPKTPSVEGANTHLFREWLSRATPEEKLSLYLSHRHLLRGTESQKKRLIKVVVEENYGGMGPGLGSYRAKRSPEQELESCKTLAHRLAEVRAAAPEFPLPETDTCTCLSREDLDARARASLVRLWLGGTDRKCKHFRVEEWPGGHRVWPYAKRTWAGEAETPFQRIPDVLRREYKDCSHAAGIHGLTFTPRLRARLTGTRLSGVTIRTQVSGTLSRMTMREDSGAWVRQADVEAARVRFDACLRAAAEGYQVDPAQLAARSASPRAVWLEFGDQGVSHAYE